MRRPSDPTYAQLAARIPARLHHAVKLAAFAAEVTVQDWIADALARHLERCRRPRAGEPPSESA